MLIFNSANIGIFWPKSGLACETRAKASWEPQATPVPTVANCPAANQQISPRNNLQRFYSYSQNFYLGGRNGGGAWTGTPGPRQLTDARLTSEKWWFSDGAVSSFSGGRWYLTHGSWQLMSNPEGALETGPYGWDERFGFEPHPGNTMNFAFGDGRVEGLSYQHLVNLHESSVDDFRRFSGYHWQSLDPDSPVERNSGY